MARLQERARREAAERQNKQAQPEKRVEQRETRRRPPHAREVIRAKPRTEAAKRFRRWPGRALLVVAFAALLALVMAGFAEREALKDRIETLEEQVLPPPQPDDDALRGGPTEAVAAELEAVADGDTIDVRIGSASDQVRLIGIDTPEPGETGAAEATARIEELLTNAALYLETDTTERDRYNRLLRYAWTLDDAGAWTLVNLTLVTEGLARASPFPPDERYAERFRAAETVARAERRGIWASPAAAARDDCHPSYPDVCIPPLPPDLDCGEIPFRRFQVIGSDPHRFDPDRDGIGCES